MLQGLRTVVYRVPDLAKARDWYAHLLGQSAYFDEPFYVGFNVGGYELGLVPLEGQPAGSTTYWGVPNADEGLAHLLKHGATVHEPVTEVGGGIKVAAVLDPSGNVVGIIENPHFKLP